MCAASYPVKNLQLCMDCSVHTNTSIQLISKSRIVRGKSQFSSFINAVTQKLSFSGIQWRGLSHYHTLPYTVERNCSR